MALGDIEYAIADLEARLKEFPWATVKTTLQDPGNKVLILITAGARADEQQFGRTKVRQGIILAVYFAGQRNTATSYMAKRLGEIRSKIVEDRRRGGNALTTVIDDEWYPSESNGRDGSVFTTTVEVHVYE